MFSAIVQYIAIIENCILQYNAILESSTFIEKTMKNVDSLTGTETSPDTQVYCNQCEEKPKQNNMRAYISIVFILKCCKDKEKEDISFNGRKESYLLCTVLKS